MALMQTLRDNFDDNVRNAALWSDPGSHVVEVNQELETTTLLAGAYYYLTSVATYDLTGSYLYAKLIDAGNQSLVSLEAILRVQLDSNNALFWSVNGGLKRAYKRVAGVTTQQWSATYDAFFDLYFRIRETGGTTYWETSKDSISWRIRYSEANPFVVTALSVLVGAGTWAVEASTSVIKWDFLNYPVPALSKAETLQDNFDDNSINAIKWDNLVPAQIIEANGQIEATSTLASGYYYLASHLTYNLTGSYVMAKLVDAGNQALTSLEALIRLEDGNNALYWSVNGNQIKAYKQVAGVTTQVGASSSYAAHQHRWFRIREHGGTIYWETSICGVIWETRQTQANPITVTSLTAMIGVGTWAAEASTTVVKWDSFGTIPPLGPVIPYVGAWELGLPQTFANVDILEAQFGWKLNILHWYAGYDMVFPGTYHQAFLTAHARGAIPMLSLGPITGSQTLQNITNGVVDGYLHAWAQGIASLPFDIFVRPMWEMNDPNSNYAWCIGVNGNVAADFAPAWQHIVNLFTADGATNCIWVWCPNVTYTGTAPLADIWPGADYVDWTGMDIYNATEAGGTWLGFSDAVDNASFTSYSTTIALAPTKPFMFGEIGCGEAGGSKEVWITEAFDAIRRAYPNCRAVVWFDENVYWGVNFMPFRIDSSASSIAAFAAIDRGQPEYRYRRPETRPFSIVTQSPDGVEHVIPDATPPVYGFNYPGGCASLTFQVPRPGRNFYPLGIGPFYTAQVYQGLSRCWGGEIRSVEPSQDDAEWLTVTAYGKGVVLKDKPYNRVWQDKRYDAWIEERPTGYEGFDADQESRIYFRVKMGELYYQDEDRVSYLYKLPASAHHPANVAKVSATIAYNLGGSSKSNGSWELLGAALDDNGAVLGSTVIATTGKNAAYAWSWTVPAGTRQVRIYLYSKGAQVEAPPEGHMQETNPHIEYMRLQDVAGLASNMLLNPSFETWPAPPAAPPNWTIFGSAVLDDNDGTAAWKKHEYRAMFITTAGVDGGVYQNRACAAQTLYYPGIWVYPGTGQCRLRVDDGVGGNAAIIGTSAGAGEQLLSGTYTTAIGQVNIRYYLEVLYSVSDKNGAFDMAWLFTSAIPNPLEEYAPFNWSVATNGADNNFTNDMGAMAFEEVYASTDSNGVADPSDQAGHKGWKARVHWQGTGVKIYGMKGPNFTQMTFQTFDDVGVAVDGVNTVDCYAAAAAFKQQLYSIASLTRARYYTDCIITKTHHASAIELLHKVAGSTDYYIPQGWSFFQAPRTDIYATITNLAIASTTAATLTADDVADDIVSLLSAAAYGLSSDNSLVATGSTRDLLPLVFLDDDDCQSVLEACLSAGDQGNAPLAWAVWEDAKLVVEAVPLSSIGYYLRPDQTEGLDVSSDLSETVLEVYGIYQDADGRPTRTAVQTSANAALLYGGRKRVLAVGIPPELVPTDDPRQMKGIIGTRPTVDKVTQYLQTFLAENDDPRVRATVVIKEALLNPDGGPVPLALVRPGKLLQIARLGAPASGSDLRDRFSTFLVTRTEYDSGTGSLRLTLGGDQWGLAEMLARAQR